MKRADERGSSCRQAAEGPVQLSELGSFLFTSSCDVNGKVNGNCDYTEGLQCLGLVLDQSGEDFRLKVKMLVQRLRNGPTFLVL